MRVVPFGERGVMVSPELASSTLAARAEEVVSLARVLVAALPDAEVVAGGTRVLVVGPSEELVKRAASAWVVDASGSKGRGSPDVGKTEPALHVLDVVYDGDDLHELAARAGLSRAAVVGLHTEREYVALVAGFLPGFAYLGELPPELAGPRRASPRTCVPAGSVGVAGAMTGVYPFASPGGWHLLGRAVAPKLFDPSRDPARRIRPLDRVRFVDVGADRVCADAPRAHPHPGLAPPALGTRALVVEGGSPFATVQDVGRLGQLGEGIPRSGALDPEGLARANRAVGNHEGSAAVEVPLGSLAVRARGELVVSVDGLPAKRLADGQAFEVPADARRGVRTLAVRGGVEVPCVLGSRSTLLVAALGGLQGRCLRRGDVLAVGPEPARAHAGDAASDVAPSPMRSLSPERPDEIDGSPLTLRIQVARLDDRLGPAAEGSLFGGIFALSTRSNRMGFRLDGDRLPRAGDDRALPEPVMPGVVQVTTDGGLIVLGPDAAVTGGYPVVGVLTRASLTALGRAAPGRDLRFAPC